MSAGIIATLILVGVGVLVAIAYVSQSIENAKQERRRQILALQDRTRTGWNLITELPPTYLPTSLRQFLLQYLTARYQDILSIDPKHSGATSQLKNINELNEQPYSSDLDTPEPIFGDLLTAKNAAGRIKDLVNYFAELHKDGALDKAQAQQYINQGKALYAVIKADIGQLTARQVEASDNAKLALAHYNNCRKNLEPFNSKGQMQQRIKFLDERIQALKAKAQEQEKAEQEAKEQEKLKDEWNEFDKGDEDWKIKHEYE
ncbi:MAG: hypothetical protein OQK12_18595 [Motiliproteus sp.]|nr:hypothetical protein [Motiliproteus sp.]MCW9051887.1 hypothetical protein [Motiliproteus sp.]